MAVIQRNDYGAIAVNKGVIEKILVTDLLNMKSGVFLSNKKGKLIKGEKTHFVSPDCYDAVEVYQKKYENIIKVYIIVKFGKSMSDIASEIMDKFDDDFRNLGLDVPSKITVYVKGMMAKHVVPKNIEFIRKN